jgi:hypothetical protein
MLLHGLTPFRVWINDLEVPDAHDALFHRLQFYNSDGTVYSLCDKSYLVSFLNLVKHRRLLDPKYLVIDGMSRFARGPCLIVTLPAILSTLVIGRLRRQRSLAHARRS